MQLINSIVSLFFKERLKNIQYFIENPLEKQQSVFQGLIAAAKDTEWGKKYDYCSIKTIADFKGRVPLQDYDSIKPFVEKMMKGSQNVLWPSKITWFAKSSGTTSDKSKFIPVSKEALENCHYRGGKDFVTKYFENFSDSNLFDGKGIIVGGSHQINQLGNKSYYGDISAVLLQNLPLLGKLFSTPRLEVALMDEWEKKIDLMAKKTINENITNISGVPTWTIVLIKHVFKLTGKNKLHEVWPNLELYLHGGVNFEPYKEQFNNFITSGNKINYFETYNASEGFFAFQDVVNEEQMLLLLDHGVFYEFLPLSELDSDNPSTLQLDEVKTDENYALIISTNSGLWRYQIGDTIKFTSLAPYKIQVTGRTKHFINAFGEELIIDNTEKALSMACKKTNSTVKEYTAAPIYFSGKDNGGHEWLIEFENEPTNIELFTSYLDKALQSVNSDYEAKRYKDIALKPPVIRKVAKGTFYEWLKLNGKLGGQHKIPRLSNDRKFVEEILKLLD